MSELENVDLSTITPEQFAELAKAAGDDELVGAIRAVGTDRALDRIFQGFQERFRPDRAEGVHADVQFHVEDEGTTHDHVVRIADGRCTAERGVADDPKVALRLEVLPFVKLVTGQAQGPMLFMRRKLAIDGDVMFASRLMNYFDQPKA